MCAASRCAKLAALARRAAPRPPVSPNAATDHQLVSDAAQTDAIVSGDNGILDTFQRGAIFATGSTLGPEPVQRIAMKICREGRATRWTCRSPAASSLRAKVP